MPNALPLLQIERQLLERAGPTTPVRRKIRELAEHHEDLKHDALEEGLSETEAEARADKLLGEPSALAEHLAAALRQSSWWGRHPIIGFCLLPPLGILALALLGLLLDSVIGQFYFTPDQISALVDDSSGMMIFKSAVLGTYYAAILLTVSIFCLFARRTVAGPKWALIACVVCALHGWLFKLTVVPHMLMAGYYPQPDWIPVLTPLAVAAAIWVKHRRWSRAAWGGTRPRFKVQTPQPRLNLPRTQLLTPTSVLASLLFLAISFIVVMAWMANVKWTRHNAELRAKTWPAERAAAMKRIANRQAVKETTGETTIDLKSKVNAALADSFNAAPGATGNTLAALPAGTHIFGGVPFDVEGKVQLWGRGLADSTKKFPARARNLPVARKCGRIHLLHGAAFANEDLLGTNVARLVLHYADGSQAEIGIKAGEHLQDWWGPVYTTATDAKLRRTTAPGTELAWIGVNPRIKKQQPESSLRLYKSTFENPHPDREISSLDYASTLTEAAPFLLGLTVE